MDVEVDTAMPIEAVGTMRWPWTVSSVAIALLMRSATFSTPGPFCTSGTTTTNSSPPNRPTRSDGRSTDAMRSATSARTSSPAAWPSESLTSLKLSRSMNSTPTRELDRRAARRSASSMSRIQARLRSPVSASWKAW